MTDPKYTRLYHRGALINDHGEVSALCFSKPHSIDLTRASWTNRDEAVTCKKCLAIIRSKAAA